MTWAQLRLELLNWLEFPSWWLDSVQQLLSTAIQLSVTDYSDCFTPCYWLQGFRNYDINRLDAVSKGEFRRVLEAFALPLTSEQFESIVVKVPTDRSGALLYLDFLDTFYGKDKTSKEEWVSGSYRCESHLLVLSSLWYSHLTILSSPWYSHLPIIAL